MESPREREAIPGDIVERLRDVAEARKRRSEDSLRAVGAGDDDMGRSETATTAFSRVRRTMIEAERDELLLWRDSGHLPDTGLRLLESELDHEEGALPPPVS